MFYILMLYALQLSHQQHRSGLNSKCVQLTRGNDNLQREKDVGHTTTCFFVNLLFR